MLDILQQIIEFLVNIVKFWFDAYVALALGVISYLLGILQINMENINEIFNSQFAAFLQSDAMAFLAKANYWLPLSEALEITAVYLEILFIIWSTKVLFKIVASLLGAPSPIGD